MVSEVKTERRYYELLNILFDILIDEEAYENVNVDNSKERKAYWDELAGIDALKALRGTKDKDTEWVNPWTHVTRRILDTLRQSNTRILVITDSNNPKVVITSRDNNHTEQGNHLWIPLFIAKKLRSLLLRARCSEALEALDDVAGFLMGQVACLTSQNHDPDFEVLYYLEAAACHRDHISIGCAQEALNRIRIRQRHCNVSKNKERERDPYELVALYNEALTLAHRPDYESKAQAVDKYYALIRHMDSDADWLPYQQTFDRICSANGRNLWKYYVFVPVLLGQAEVLLDLQRTYDCERILELANEQFSIINTLTLKFGGQYQLTLDFKYRKLQYNILKAFGELDKGELTKDEHIINEYKEYKDTIHKISNNVPDNRPGLRVMADTLSARLWRDIEQYRLVVEGKLTLDIYQALKIPNFEKTLDKIERVDQLYDWLETFQLVVDYIINRKKVVLTFRLDRYKSQRSKQCNNSYWEIKANLINSGNTMLHHFYSLALLDRLLNDCELLSGWLPKRYKLTKKSVDVIKKLNDQGNSLRDALASLGTTRSYCDSNKAFNDLRFDLIHLECTLIDKHFLNSDDKPVYCDRLKYIRRLERLRSDAMNINVEDRRFKVLAAEIDLLIEKRNKEQTLGNRISLKLPVDSKLNNITDFLQSTPTDHYLQIMCGNTEQLDARLVFQSRHKGLEGSIALTVLRRWQSYTPSLSGGSVYSVGGGYFVYKINQAGVIDEGLVIDPGFDFIENFLNAGFCIPDISGVIMTHDHPDHTADFRTILMLFVEMNKRGQKRLPEWRKRKLTVVATAGAMRKFYSEIEDSKEYFSDAVVADPLVDTPLDGLYRFFKLQPVPAFHPDLRGSDGMGLVIESESCGRLIGFSGDTVWVERLAEYYRGCPVMCLNLGGLIDVRQGHTFKTTLDRENIQKFIANQNHLYLPGFILLLRELTDKGCPHLAIVSEIGEELKGGLRTEFAETVQNYFRGKVVKPPLRVLAEDTGLTVDLSQKTIQCDKCRGFVEVHSIRAVTRRLGRDSEELVHYCPECYERYIRLTRSEQLDY